MTEAYRHGMGFSHEDKTMKNCLNCKGEFKGKKRKQKYCGRSCYETRLTTKLMLFCVYCRASLVIGPWQIKRGRGRFCSKKCQGLNKRRRILRNCQICSKEFFKKPAQLRGERYGLYCSKSCAGRSRTGERSNFYNRNNNYVRTLT